MTGLIPAYLKTVYKKEPVFAHSKIVFTIGQNTFKEKLGSGFIKKALIHASLKDKDLEVYKEGTNTAMFRGGATFADAITFGAEKIEKKLGRVNKHNNAARTIDIDILFYEDIILKSKNLEIPHPRLHMRNFTLQPMLELNKSYTHPVFHKSIKEMFV